MQEPRAEYSSVRPTYGSVMHTRPEIEALLASPNQRTHLGRRDHLIILLAVVTGLRVSELVGLRCRDIVLGSGAHVNCLGKGRKGELLLL